MGAIAFDTSIHRYCGGLKENGSIRSGPIRKCGFLRIPIALFEEACHCGAGFEVSYAQTVLSVAH